MNSHAICHGARHSPTGAVRGLASTHSQGPGVLSTTFDVGSETKGQRPSDHHALPGSDALHVQAFLLHWCCW